MTGAGWLEPAAVALGLAYVLLAIGQRRACWLAGGLSAALYVPLLAAQQIYLQAALQLLYVALAAYGWWRWRPGDDAAPPQPRSWAPDLQLALAAAVLAATAATAPLLAQFSDAASPWQDALWFWASIAATWLLARKVLENWLWWIVTDLGLAVFYARSGLLPTAGLYLAYALLATAGWRAWRRAMRDAP